MTWRGRLTAEHAAAATAVLQGKVAADQARALARLKVEQARAAAARHERAAGQAARVTAAAERAAARDAKAAARDAKAEQRRARRAAARDRRRAAWTEWRALLSVLPIMGMSAAVALPAQLEAFEALTGSALSAAAIAAMIEGGTWAGAAMESIAVRRGQPTGAYVALTWGCASIACAMNIAHGLDGGLDGHHIQLAAAYGLASLLGPIAWAVYSRLQRHIVSGRTGEQAMLAAVRRLRYPIESWRALSLRAARGVEVSVEDAWAQVWAARQARSAARRQALARGLSWVLRRPKPGQESGVQPESGGLESGVRSGVESGGLESGVRSGVESGGLESGVRSGVESGGLESGVRSGVESGGLESGVRSGVESGGLESGVRSGVASEVRSSGRPETDVQSDRSDSDIQSGVRRLGNRRTRVRARGRSRHEPSSSPDSGPIGTKSIAVMEALNETDGSVPDALQLLADRGVTVSKSTAFAVAKGWRTARGPVSGPVSGGPVSGPVSGGPVSGPVSGGPVSGPVSGGPVSGPVSGGPVSGPVSGGPVSGPVSGGPVSGPVSGGPVSGPVSGGPVSGPVSGGPESVDLRRLEVAVH